MSPRGLARIALVGLLGVLGGPSDAAPPEVVPIDLELDGAGTNIDDPCMWVDPRNPGHGLLFATAKSSHLVEVFDLPTGTPVGTIPGFSKPNNCSVEGDLLLTTDRNAHNVKVHHIPDLALVRTFASDTLGPMGIAVLHTPGGQTLVYVSDEVDASVHVYDLATGTRIRTFATGFGLRIEPLATDDLYQRVFVAREEDTGHGIGLFTPEGTLVREFGANVFGNDTEGIALYRCGNGGYLIASDQNLVATQFEVFDRVTLGHLGTFTLQDGTGDFTNATDGLEVLQTPMPGFPNGLLAACDGCGDSLPDETDVVSWDRIASVMGLNLCPDGVAPDCQAAPCIQRLLPIADATVNALTPNVNDGAGAELEIGAEPSVAALLRFDVPDLTGFDLQRGTLRLSVGSLAGSDGPSGGTLYATSADWSESTVTWATRPQPLGPALGSTGPVTLAEAVDFDVRDAVRRGTSNFLLGGGAPDRVHYRSREAGESPPTLLLTLKKSTPPTLTVTAPASGLEVTPGTPVTCTATAGDAEDGDLTAAVRWRSDRDGILGSGSPLTVTTLSSGVHAITAEVTDGANLRATATRVVRVNARPAVTIALPAAGTETAPGEPLLLEASATDAEDGDLSASLRWASDVAGPLGTGSSLVTTALGSGRHTITASVHDASGASASAAVGVLVNGRPQVTIGAPAGATASPGGTPLVLAATAFDAEDGDLTSALTWTSDRDGALGTGAVLSVRLSEGAHRLVAAVQDSAGAGAAAGVAVTITPAPPALRLIAPGAPTAVTEGEPLVLTADATDFVDGDLATAIRWSSDLQGPLGTGATVTTPLTRGTHTLTASVTDSDGLTASASVGVRVVPAVVTFPAVADATTTAATPDGNYGTAKNIEADASPVVVSYLRFLVSGTAGFRVDQALLQLTVAPIRGAPSASGGSVYGITDTGWQERGITFATRPPVTGLPLATLGTVKAGATLSIDVTRAVTGDGPVALALASRSTDAVKYSSREAATGRPVLVLHLRAVRPSAPPTVTITAPADGATIALGTPPTLTAVATDTEDGDLSAAIEWRSDVSGLLGVGASLSPALPFGVHRLTATVADRSGTRTTAAATIVIGPGTLALAPSADATVKSDVPAGNSGGAATLQADSSPVRRSYLRFPVAGVAAGHVTRAVLRLTVSPELGSGSPSGGSIHRITPTGWTEKAVTFTTSPPVDGPPLATAGRVVEGQVVDFDLTGVVPGDGLYEFALDTASSDRVAYGSRESGASGPRLLLTVE